jgi:hypothetical protein
VQRRLRLRPLPHCFHGLGDQHPYEGVTHWNSGADDRIRTGDLLITNPIQAPYAGLRSDPPQAAALLYVYGKAMKFVDGSRASAALQ